MEIPTLEVKDISLFAVWKWKCDEVRNIFIKVKSKLCYLQKLIN